MIDTKERRKRVEAPAGVPAAEADLHEEVATYILDEIAEATSKRIRDGIEAATEHPMCTCCEESMALVVRPDFGTDEDEHAMFAICVLHDPPMVYTRSDSGYRLDDTLSLNHMGDIMRGDETIAKVQGDFYQRLSTIDDDDDDDDDTAGTGTGSGTRGASRPSTSHVDLTEDDFYQ